MHDPWQERLDYTQSPDPEEPEQDSLLLDAIRQVSVQLQITAQQAEEQMLRMQEEFMKELSWNPVSQAQGLMQPLPGPSPEETRDNAIEDLLRIVRAISRPIKNRYPTSVDMSRQRRPRRSGKDPGKR